MRIHIIGAGVVGRATGRGFERFGHEVLYSDKGDDHNAVRSDITFICTPEGVVPEVVRSLVRTGPSNHVVIRSSVPPGTTQRLADATKLHLCHNPEFLREATAEADLLGAPVAIVGSPSWANWDPNTFLILKALYEEMGKLVRHCSSTESELLKLLNNAHLASLISWWNEAATLCRALGVNSHHLAHLMVENDDRISPYGALRHGAPYGGRCLPKDIDQVVSIARQHDLRMQVLRAVELVNDTIQQREE